MNTETKTTERMKVLNPDFVKDIMSVPTCSYSEQIMVAYIENWAEQRNICHERDAYGNLYLTKGEVAEGEYYPCLTSHLDTVQDQQEAYVEKGERLPLIEEERDGRHILRCDGFGIGADCKSGLAICLGIMEQTEVCKCCFFLEEEVGCKGSRNMDLRQLDQVGYVLGFDSPERDRAAWACSWTPLFDAKFHQQYLKDVCAKHGLTHFYAEPWTDVKIIRERTGLTCANFGNGGYKAHTRSEYCIIEEMDASAQMGLELVNTIGCIRPDTTGPMSEEDSDYLMDLGM